MMTIELTEAEVKTLLFYLDKAIIDAAGMAAIGVGDGSFVKNLESIKRKVVKVRGK